MALFGKRRQDAQRPCAWNPPTEVKVLGSGCARCAALETATRRALAGMGLDTPVEHVTDFAQIAAYGVMSMPALVVDGKVVVSGKALSVSEADALLRKTLVPRT